MLLRKYMSLIGVGSAQVDLLLLKDQYHIGECVEGYFQINGGVVEQEIKRIECDLVMMNLTEENTEHVVDSVTILTSKKVDTDDCNQISFCFRIPKNIAASSKDVSYRFKTRMVFKKGTKSIDQDIIKILEGVGNQ